MFASAGVSSRSSSPTTIRYALPISSHVVLDVYNTLGERVFQLVEEQRQPGEVVVR
ncbi:MAG TPA: hypothetical protein VNL69_08490 [Bacteroidota bacterium]|nr:hypothetical protein [Bacteroidota bacterium]